jgi:hypothetical protein
MGTHAERVWRQRRELKMEERLFLDEMIILKAHDGGD